MNKKQRKYKLGRKADWEKGQKNNNQSTILEIKERGANDLGIKWIRKLGSSRRKLDWWKKKMIEFCSAAFWPKTMCVPGAVAPYMNVGV